MSGDEIRIVFDGPPGPEPARFVEINNVDGISIQVGVWTNRDDGLCELRISGVNLAEDEAVRNMVEDDQREEVWANGQFGVGA